MADGVKKINEWIMKDGRTIILTLDNITANKMEGGTLRVLPSQGNLHYVNIDSTGAKTWKKFEPVNIFDSKSITSDLLADGCVTNPKLAIDSVTSDKIVNQNITTDKIKNLAVTSDKLASNSVISDKLASNSVTTDKIASGAVTSSKIGNSAVTSDKIAVGNVLTTHLAERTILKDRIKRKELTNEEIADGTIINSLMAANSIYSSNIKAGEVKEANLATNAVTNAKIMAGAVYGNKIPTNGIEDVHIRELTGSKINDNTIPANKLMKNSVVTSNIADLNVTMAKLDSNVQANINNAIRVVASQNIDNATVTNAAWVKGSLYVLNPSGANSLLKVKGDIEATGDITGARVFNPCFADVAEAYVPTEDVKIGDPVSLSLEGDLKIEKLNSKNKDRFLGFVSDDYAAIFGATREELRDKKKVAVTLIGRIKISMNKECEGTIGDFVRVSSCGEIKISKTRCNDCVGRLLENKVAGQEYVLCQLWP